MSVFARKRTSVGRKYTSMGAASSHVQFCTPNGNLQSTFQSYADKSDSKNYETLLLMMTENKLTDENIITLIAEATKCVSVLNAEFHLFIEAALNVDWTTKSPKMIHTFQSFLHALMTVQHCHTKNIINHLVKYFITDDNMMEWVNNRPSEEETIKYNSVHQVFRVMMKIFPMIKEEIFSELSSQFPYTTKTAHHFEVYLYNLLRIVDYCPTLRKGILRLIFSELVVMDAHSPKEAIAMEEEKEKEDIFEMDDRPAMRLPIANALDVSMKMIFEYFEGECLTPETKQLNWDKTKELTEL